LHRNVADFRDGQLAFAGSAVAGRQVDGIISIIRGKNLAKV